jgi:hypothetical protein
LLVALGASRQEHVEIYHGLLQNKQDLLIPVVLFFLIAENKDVR